MKDTEVTMETLANSLEELLRWASNAVTQAYGSYPLRLMPFSLVQLETALSPARDALAQWKKAVAADALERQRGTNA